jgi:hypothetical protein
LASGGNDIDSSPLQEVYALYPVVALGGPNEPDQFYDIRSDWLETEVRQLAIQ